MAEVEALRSSLAKEAAQRQRLERKLARQFQELQAKNAELTESLTQQTATSEILRVISRSPTDIQPVLDTVAESATRLCEAYDATIFRRDGDQLRLVAQIGRAHV